MPNWADNTIIAIGDTETIAALSKKVISTDPARPSLFSLEAIHPLGEWDYHAAVTAWGTKWDVDCTDHETTALPDGRAAAMWRFASAWSPPTRALDTLARDWPDVTFYTTFNTEGGHGSGADIRAGEGSIDVLSTDRHLQLFLCPPQDALATIEGSHLGVTDLLPDGVTVLLVSTTGDFPDPPPATPMYTVTPDEEHPELLTISDTPLSWWVSLGRDLAWYGDDQSRFEPLLWDLEQFCDSEEFLAAWPQALEYAHTLPAGEQRELLAALAAALATPTGDIDGQITDYQQIAGDLLVRDPKDQQILLELLAQMRKTPNGSPLGRYQAATAAIHADPAVGRD